MIDALIAFTARIVIPTIPRLTYVC